MERTIVLVDTVSWNRWRPKQTGEAISPCGLLWQMGDGV